MSLLFSLLTSTPSRVTIRSGSAGREEDDPLVKNEVLVIASILPARLKPSPPELTDASELA